MLREFPEFWERGSFAEFGEQQVGSEVPPSVKLQRYNLITRKF